MKRNVSDHDYAHIGPAPSLESLESLDEPIRSPPYIPDGGNKQKFNVALASMLFPLSTLQVKEH